jgi:Flp pilus assembly CpaF family ATPase
MPCELRVSLSATQPCSTPWNRCDDIVSALVHWSQLLHEPGVTDVLVNGPNQVFIDRGAGLELTELRFHAKATYAGSPSA